MAEYIPFGNDWKRNVMRMRKADIVELFKSARIEVEKLKSTNTSSSKLPEWDEVLDKVTQWWLRYDTDVKASVYNITRKVYDIIAGKIEH